MTGKKGVASSHAKYTSRNPASRLLVANFFRTLEHILSRLSFTTVLDAGCGEGILLSRMETVLGGKSALALDRDHVELRAAARNVPSALCCQGDICDLPFRNRQFDVILCLEVLEHLPLVDVALGELERVCGRYCLLSVPDEPLWRTLNMARGAYLNRWGNTPGHVNRWSSKAFRTYVSRSFDIVEVHRPLPWTVVVAKKREG